MSKSGKIHSLLKKEIIVLDGAAGYPASPAAWVLELSSFQLETTHTLSADAATVLNVSEDHLDRYTGMDDYAAAKARVFQGSGVMLLNRDDARCRGWQRSDRKTVSFGLNPAPLPGDYGFVDGWIVRGGEKLVALIRRRMRISVGDRLSLTFEDGQGHLFDADSGQRLNLEPAFG